MNKKLTGVIVIMPVKDYESVSNMIWTLVLCVYVQYNGMSLVHSTQLFVPKVEDGKWADVLTVDHGNQRM